MADKNNNLLPVTEEDLNELIADNMIANLALSIVHQVKEGNVSPLSAKIASALLKGAHEILEKELQEEIMAEANKYPGNQFTYMGLEFVKGSKSTYIIEDTKLEQLKEQVKNREKLIKSLKEPVVDPETGEFINPPIIKKTDYVYIKKTKR